MKLNEILSIKVGQGIEELSNELGKEFSLDELVIQVGFRLVEKSANAMDAGLNGVIICRDFGKENESAIFKQNPAQAPSPVQPQKK